jgi:hypothetical protein
MGILKKITNTKTTMTPRKRPPSKKPLPRKLLKLKPRTETIDPKLPRGKAGKGPLEPTDSKTRVISKPPTKRKKFKQRIRKDRGLPEMPPKGSIRASSATPPPPLKKRPDMRSGGVVSNSKATGAAKRGFGKAYMKGKK